MILIYLDLFYSQSHALEIMVTWGKMSKTPTCPVKNIRLWEQEISTSSVRPHLGHIDNAAELAGLATIIHVLTSWFNIYIIYAAYDICL